MINSVIILQMLFITQTNYIEILLRIKLDIGVEF